MAETQRKRPAWLNRRNVLLAAAVWVVGSLFGVGIFTFAFAQGASYLGTDPYACRNCHVMEPWYDGWEAGSHRNVATCNDCHAPHDNIVHKYLNKGENGFRHAVAFTTGWHPENIQIRETNRTVTNAACLYCHGDYVSDIHLTRPPGEQIDCTQCHSDVGHQ